MSGYNLPEGIYQNPYDNDTCICSDCGDEVDEDEVECIGNKLVCRSCLEYEYTKCSECHQYIKNDELTEISEHEILCEDCFVSKAYTICKVCNKLEKHEADVEYPYLCSECSKDLEHLK